VAAKAATHYLNSRELLALRHVSLFQKRGITPRYFRAGCQEQTGGLREEPQIPLSPDMSKQARKAFFEKII